MISTTQYSEGMRNKNMWLITNCGVQQACLILKNYYVIHCVCICKYKEKMKNINLFFDVTLCDVRVYLVTRLRVINSRLEHSVTSILSSKLFGCSKENRFYSSNLHLPKTTIWSFYGDLNQFWRLTCISHFSYSFITPL